MARVIKANDRKPARAKVTLERLRNPARPERDAAWQAQDEAVVAVALLAQPVALSRLLLAVPIEGIARARPEAPICVPLETSAA